MVLDGVFTTTANNQITVENVRIASDKTTLNDFISIDTVFDGGSLQLHPVSFSITKNLGVYEQTNGLFSTDVPNEPAMTTPDGNVLGPDLQYSISAVATDKFTMQLEAGTVMAFKIQNPTDDFELVIKTPTGNESRGLYQKGTNWVNYGHEILKSGIYTFQFVPQHNTSVSLSFGFSNQNSRLIEPLSSGDAISTTLSGWGKQYAKYQLKLNAGDTLAVSDAYDSDIRLILVNSNSQLVKKVDAGKFIAKVAQSGTYYLFVVNDDYWSSSSYSGSVAVTADLNRTKYPVLAAIPKQKASLGANYSLSLSATKSPTEFKASGLPTGLSINAATGKISGTPSLAGTFAISAVAKNKYGSNRKDFIMEVAP